MAESGTIQSMGTTPSSREDSGATFIEILVSVVLLGIGGIAVLVGMAATLRGTATHDRLATVQSNLSDAGDHLTDVTYNDITASDETYVSCGGAVGAYTTEVSPWQVNVVSVDFWDGSGWTDTSGCVGGEMQRITLTASIEGLQRQLVVVKREATVAITPGGAWNDGMVTPVQHPSLP